MATSIQRLGELSKDGVFIYDLGPHKFVYLNANFASFFDTDQEKLLRQPGLIQSFIYSEDQYYLQHRLEELKKEKSLSGTEFRLQFEGGPLRHFSCDCYLMDETSQVVGFVKNITKEKEHEDYIINYGARKDTLLDMLTHNLSGPLLLSQNILNWVQQEYRTNAANISDQLHMIQDNTQHCLDIVNDFLQEEHLESERIYVKKTRFDLLERIRATLEKLIATNRNKKFRLITDLESVNISTDSVKFFQIIHNLLSNSIKFTPDGGEIDILVEETDSSFIISVKDNGIGIPKKFHTHLFDTRSHAMRPGLRNEHSSGMGLSIVKALTSLIGGTVSFESEEGKGSLFSVELPKD